ncbi:hypothetical protein [Bradyrhizobium sp. CCBAU 45389]|uniref:hypothetical protein n=1 Tax=Bradyrhizobium sp. CCBAU 45389 TaxID=858429 RepID=UPI00230625EA|nr:hypothetical protein [Bradyrhizobium sp. CCBAU 45389]
MKNEIEIDLTKLIHLPLSFRGDATGPRSAAWSIEPGIPRFRVWRWRAIPE